MQETLVTSGTMTNRLDRLEELKLITRQPDPDDGRGSLVTLTASGMRAVDKALDGLLEHERDLLKGLTREQRLALADLLSALAAHLEEN
jgi:DNA-binding MarR family transcriptional regulator